MSVKKHWLAFQAVKSGKRKGIKLDFKSTEVVEEAYKVLPELIKEVSQLEQCIR